MAYFFLVQFLNTLDNLVVGIRQNDMVFLSGFVMNRIGIADFAIAMVFLGGFVVKRIGIANFANHGGSGGGGSGGDIAEVAKVEAAAVVPWRFCKSWGDSSFRAR
jgi:hypothetical protein